MPELQLQASTRTTRPRAFGLSLLVVMMASACAAVGPDSARERLATDVWDVSLLPVRHLDPGMQAFGDAALNATGFASAVAADADRLYVTDAGSQRILEVNLATESIRSIGRLRDASSPGLAVGYDGRVYALDPADRALQILDPFSGERQRVSIADRVGTPVDLALIDGYRIVVLDAVDGRAVVLDLQGGVYAEHPLRRPKDPVVASARAIASVGQTLLVLDDRADDVAGFDANSRSLGLFASNELSDPRAMAADACGRFFVADSEAGTIYVGVSDMSVPGARVIVENLGDSEVTDLWTDGVFLYAATRVSGIFVYLVDPGCD